MKTDKISFGRRFLPIKTTTQVWDLKSKMVSQSATPEKLYGFSLLTKSKHPDELIFRDVLSQDGSEAEMKIGKKILLTINPKNGEIMLQKSKVPTLTSWKQVYKKIENFMNNIKANFDNSELIEQRFLNLPTFIIDDASAKKLLEAQERVAKKLTDEILPPVSLAKSEITK